MKTRKIESALLMILLLTAAISAQTTAFNYQGRLTDAGNPASGAFQMEFKLFDALSGGNQIGATVSPPAVSVSQGIFSVKLDFGADALSGANRFLEIAVRRNSNETYITLAPREQIASAPYAVRTLSAAQADLALDSNKLGGLDADEYVTKTTLNTNFIRNQTTEQSNSNFFISGNGILNGRLGIGTSTPNFKVTVNPGGNSYGFAHTDGTATLASFVGFTDIGGTLGGWLGTQTNHPLFFFSNSGLPKATLDTAGRFGIGTTAPTARLTVSGNGAFTSPTAARFDLFNTTANSGYLQNVTDAGLWQIGTTAGATRMVITPTGSVGIGTIAPNAKLQIAGAGSNGFTLGVEGNVTQNLSNSGFVKALLRVFPNGVIGNCFNGMTGAPLPNCGFSVTRTGTGQYTVNFDFPVGNRFVSGNQLDNPTTFCTGGVLSFTTISGNSANLTTTCNGFEDAEFFLVVF